MKARQTVQCTCKYNILLYQIKNTYIQPQQWESGSTHVMCDHGNHSIMEINFI